jgi:hypothetical protein
VIRREMTRREIPMIGSNPRCILIHPTSEGLITDIDVVVR